MLSNVSRGVCEEKLTHTCPVCGGPMGPVKDLVVTNETIYYKGQRVKLRRTPNLILIELLRRRNMIFNNRMLWDFLYGVRPDGGPDPLILNVYICQIRKAILKFRLPIAIDTIYGQGWLLHDV